MTSTRLAILMASIAALGGCATDGPATNGASVRAMVAQQVAHPQPQRSSDAVDGASAVATVKNYANSYANPQPQAAGSAFGR